MMNTFVAVVHYLIRSCFKIFQRLGDRDNHPGIQLISTQLSDSEQIKMTNNVCTCDDLMFRLRKTIFVMLDEKYFLTM